MFQVLCKMQSGNLGVREWNSWCFCGDDLCPGRVLNSQNWMLYIFLVFILGRVTLLAYRSVCEAKVYHYLLAWTSLLESVERCVDGRVSGELVVESHCLHGCTFTLQKQTELGPDHVPSSRGERSHGAARAVRTSVWPWGPGSALTGRVVSFHRPARGDLFPPPSIRTVSGLLPRRPSLLPGPLCLWPRTNIPKPLLCLSLYPPVIYWDSQLLPSTSARYFETLHHLVHA